MEQLNWSFKDYEQEFIQGAAFKKLESRIHKLQCENDHLRQQLLDAIQITKEPSLVYHESLMADDGQFGEYNEALELEALKIKEELEASKKEIQVEKEALLQEKRNLKEKKEALEEEVMKCNEDMIQRESQLHLKMKELLNKEDNLTKVSDKKDLGMQTEVLSNDLDAFSDEMVLFELKKEEKYVALENEIKKIKRHYRIWQRNPGK